ncbi:hypothetical protein P279_11245 [Rhodobacteraceae bacterium PD-2]|nr:hypothetical protein P279_11245 [Rhodobacteraceae bacterium PD-2]
MNARPLGVAHLTALELSPAEFVEAAADAGFSAVGLRLAPAAPGALCYDVRPATAGHAALTAAMARTGVRVNEVEFVPLTPGIDLAALQPLLETGAALGARALTVSGDDPEPARLADTLARLAQMARPFGLRVDVEFMRWRVIGTYEDACALLDRAAQDNTGVLLDVLHLDRSGGDFAVPDLSATGPVRAVQLCDAPELRPSGDEATIHEAREGRLAPGQGVLPLHRLLSRLEPETYVSVEVPDAARPPEERLRRAAEAALAMLSRKDTPCPEV